MRRNCNGHRYRQVRFFRDPDTAKRRRYEPWMTTLVDVDTGTVLGVVDGRGCAGVKKWLVARSPAWRNGVQVVAIDPSAAFRKAITDALPHAAVSVDHFHLVQPANQMLTMVRQRVSRDLKGRRGRAIDPSWANRRLLLRGYDTLSEKARARLKRMLREDDPTDEIGAAWESRSSCAGCWRLPQRRTLQSPYPPAQCRPTCGLNTQLSARHHVEL